MKSHIVPEGYLRSFAHKENEHFHILKIKSPYRKIRFGSVSSVCYEPGYFKFENPILHKFQQYKDPDHIEKESFKIYENNFNKIVDSLKNKPSGLLIDQAVLLIESILNIKIRNKRYRKAFDKASVRKNFARRVERFRSIWHHFENKVTDLNFGQFVEYTKINYLEKEGFYNEFYLSSILSERFKESEVFAIIKESILNATWVIGTTDESNEFITSDNPGFCIDIENNQLYNMRFEGAYALFFPLDPYHCLMITNNADESVNRSFKPISIKKTAPQQVKQINNLTAQICNVEVFAYSKDTLNLYL